MENPLAIYLHDHLAGATLAMDLLGAMRDKHPADPLGDFAALILSEVEADRATLKNLADRIGSGSSQLKEFSAWLSEKVSRIKLDSESHSLGTFEALEFLALGILGKLALWDALKVLQPADERLQGMNFDHLATARGNNTPGSRKDVWPRQEWFCYDVELRKSSRHQLPTLPLLHASQVRLFDVCQLPEDMLIRPHKPALAASRSCRTLIFILGLMQVAVTGLRAAPQTDSTLQPAIEKNYQPHTYQGQLEADDGQWIRPAKDYASTRYSSLDQITAGNVKTLKLAFTFSSGMTHGHEAAPLVVNKTMYIVTPFPNNLYALDLTKPGAPMKWVYQPSPTPASQGVACCDVVNRGASFDDGKIYYNTLDNQTVAVDAASGREVWKTRVGDINKGESMTMAPLVVRGKVLVGNSGGEFGVRGWLTALDGKTGKIVWRAYTAGPDKEVLIGSRFKPFYPQDRGQDLGVKTWPPDAWKIGGGGVWGWISYDPQLNLIYYGTANPGPWDADARPGDNKFTSGIFARNPDTGEAVWFYQFSPHDLYDYDAVNENILLDLAINGQVRKVLVHPDRNGYVYVIDRATGEVLSANAFAPITTSKGVDLKTGQLQYVEEKRPITGKVVRGLCPSAPGAKDWQPSAFSPRTGLLYIPHNHLCMDKEDLQTNYIAGTPYVGANVRMYDAPGGYGGEFTAWDPVEGKVVWTNPDHFPVWSGALATAGDVVFYGTLDGWFKAVDAHSGTLLWQFKTGSGIIGQPITYKGPDGKQYVAILSGVGGWAGAIVAGGLDARDESAALGFGAAMKDLPQYTNKGGMLYVFALP